jgi:phage baseplate assembly protein W
MSLLTNLGYTTINNEWETLTDEDLAKHDLLMYLYTRKGECDWDQSFGTNIMDKIFQPKTEQCRLDILSDIQEAFENEPRLSLVDVQTTSIDKGWIFTCLVSYLNGTPDEWEIAVSEDTATLYSNGTYPL